MVHWNGAFYSSYERKSPFYWTSSWRPVNFHVWPTTGKHALSFDFVCLSCSIYISCIFEQFKLGNIKLTSSFLYSDVICIVFRSVSLGYFSRGLNTHSMFIYAIFFLQLYRQTRFPNCLYKIYDIYNVLTFLLAFLTHCIRLSNVWL